MSRKRMYSVLSGVLLAGAGAVHAQEGSTDHTPPPMIVMLQGGMPDDGGPGGPFGKRMELLGFGGMHGGKVVQGSPFSAVAISETSQTLADGNHITRKTQTNLFRDSQGRFRKEISLPLFGPVASSGQPKSFVVINDPVAGVGYMLEPDKKVAHKMGAHEKDMAKGKFGYHKQEEAADTNLKTEDLGTQNIAGVSAQGTRRTRTIPAGQMGNEKAITIVSEQWYSNDLQLVVKSVRNDPMFGDTTYTLTNIQRTEPSASLFSVPSDYTVKNGGPGGPGKHGWRKHGPLPPPADAPASPTPGD